MQIEGINLKNSHHCLLRYLLLSAKLFLIVLEDFIVDRCLCSLDFATEARLLIDIIVGERTEINRDQMQEIDRHGGGGINSETRVLAGRILLPRKNAEGMQIVGNYLRFRF